MRAVEGSGHRHDPGAAGRKWAVRATICEPFASRIEGRAGGRQKEREIQAAVIRHGSQLPERWYRA